MTTIESIKRRLIKASGITMLLAACGLGFVSCDKYDLDTISPSWLGQSIYDYLKDNGNYTYTVKIIDDLGYSEVLARTGSKTLFVADDDAFNRFFKNNEFGVRSYEQLSTSQKKMLLFGSMINNSFQINNLSSTEGPVEGACMRRLSSETVYDTVPVLKATDMPNNPYWSRYREKGEIVCLQDMSIVPMIHFIEKHLVNNKITNDDYNFVYNGSISRQSGDASVNGVQITEQNIKCSNGFVHKVQDVMMPLKNMAELIRSKSQTSQFNNLLERFCAPYYSKTATDNYNRLYNKSVDSVFQKRFFSSKSQDGQPLNVSPDNGPVQLLKYDPEWNSYYSGEATSSSKEVALEQDMGVMMVPSNQAMEEYWNTGAGRVLKDYYGSWDRVPDYVVAELINNNMLNSFVSSVPSKFSSIMNDANDPMGVSQADIDSVWLGCNGAIYLTNKVFSPTTYVSVLFPAFINEAMSIMRWGVYRCQYNVYLNSLNSIYSFFIPTNNALLEYIDPVSFGKSTTQLFRFHYDGSKTDDAERVWASIWNYNTETKEVGDSVGKASYDQIVDRLQDILENHIILGDVTDGSTYYRTMGGSEVKVTNTGLGQNGMKIEGSWQLNEGSANPIDYIYNQENGRSYILGQEPIMCTRMTVRDILAKHEEYSMFLQLMDGSGLFETIHNNRNACGGTNISVFNTYHYTVYVPTNESIEALIAAGKLPTWEQVENADANGDYAKKSADSATIVNFLRYHIQDNAVFIGAKPTSGDFETAAFNKANESFYKLRVQSDGNQISVTDAKGNKRKVLTSDSQLYNQMAKEYLYNSSDAARATQIETSSSAVVHLIDGPLLH